MLAACLTAASTAQVETKVDEYMQALVKVDRFSGAILVAKDGHIIRAAGYEHANVEWDIPNRADTKFRIGSVTKQFTAMAVMMLQERGKLSVSDPICKYLEDCPSAWQPITVHELLTHTSGIPDYVNFPDFSRTQALPTTPQELIGRFRDKPLEFAPGEKFQYSNSGYVVLGTIIEHVAGESYQDFLRHNIFDVLKMNETGYDEHAAVLIHRAAGYQKEEGRIENAKYIETSVAYAAGALYSTVNDLMIWDQALYTNKLVSQKSLQQMFTPYKEIVGYGWAIGTMFNRKIEHHNGGIDGFVSSFARFPDDKVLVVVLCNRDGVPIDNISRDLAAIVFGEKYELPKARNVIKLDPSIQKQYVGTYRITADISLTITSEGGHFFGKISGGEAERFELFPESETKFFSEMPPVEVVFTKDEKGNVVAMTLNGEYQGKKVQ
jgi:CubicO group peptidase (beta-lactamase class C family)